MHLSRDLWKDFGCVSSPRTSLLAFIVREVAGGAKSDAEKAGQGIFNGPRHIFLFGPWNSVEESWGAERGSESK